MSDKELVERLRRHAKAYAVNFPSATNLLNEAATKIESMAADAANARRYEWLLNSLFVRWFRVGNSEIGMRAYETEPSKSEITAAIDQAISQEAGSHE